MSVNYYCLHGYLGQAKDWDFLSEGKHTFCPDLFVGPTALGPHQKFANWAASFNAWVATNRLGKKRPNILVGYSMGGRLALYAGLSEPTLWQKIVLISTNPGMLAAKEKVERLKQDSQWAQRFRSNDLWSEVLNDWNNQAVFDGGGLVPNRIEDDFDRELLAKALENWSVGQQQINVDHLKPLSNLLHWVVGEEDSKYVALMDRLRDELPEAQFHVVRSAGHRVLQDNPLAISDLIDSIGGDPQQDQRGTSI